MCARPSATMGNLYALDTCLLLSCRVPNYDRPDDGKQQNYSKSKQECSHHVSSFSAQHD